MMSSPFLGPPPGPNFSPRSPVVPTPPAPPQSGAARPRAPPGRGSAPGPPGRAAPAARRFALGHGVRENQLVNGLFHWDILGYINLIKNELR